MLNKKKLFLLISFFLITIIILSGCNNILNTDSGTASIKGKFGYINEKDELMFDTSSLIILKKDNNEITRKYISYSDNENTNFEFTDLKQGKYILEFIDFNIKNKSVEVTIDEGENYILDDVIIEFEDKERIRNDFLFLNPEINILDNKDFRLAIAHAINQSDLANNLENNSEKVISAEKANRLLSPNRYGYDDTELKLEYNVEKAINYINNTNYDMPITKDIVYNNGNDSRKVNVENIAAQINNINDLNINLNPKGLDFNDGYLEFNSISIIGSTGYGPIGILDLLTNTINLNEYEINGQTIENRFSEAYLNQDDIDKVMELVEPIEKKLINEGYYIPLVYYEVQ